MKWEEKSGNWDQIRSNAIIKKITSFFFLFYVKDSSRWYLQRWWQPTDQWIVVTAEIRQDGILHTSCGKQQKLRKKKPVDVKWTGWLLQSRFDTRPAAGTLGSRAAEQGFVLQPGLTQRKKVFYRCKVAQNFMLYRCCCTIEFLMARLPFNWWQTTNFACVKEAAVAAACRRADGLPEQSYWLVAAATFGSGGLINKLLTLKNC